MISVLLCLCICMLSYLCIMATHPRTAVSGDVIMGLFFAVPQVYGLDNVEGAGGKEQVLPHRVVGDLTGVIFHLSMFPFTHLRPCLGVVGQFLIPILQHILRVVQNMT